MKEGDDCPFPRGKKRFGFYKMEALVEGG